MNDNLDPYRLLQAAKLAVCLFELAHGALYSIYPHEALVLLDKSEYELNKILADYFSKAASEVKDL